MSLSSIAHKLRALRAIAEPDSGATEAERESALTKYEELLRKYHLDASELDLREEGVVHIRLHFDTRGNAYTIAEIVCGAALAKFTKTKLWGSPKRGTADIMGLRSDAEFAEWLARSLVAHIQREALEFSLNAMHGDLFQADIETFVKAAAIRVRDRIKSMIPNEAPGSALVVIRSKMIDEEFAKLGITLRSRGRAEASGRAHALHAGTQAGDRASFARPVSGAALQIGRA